MNKLDCAIMASVAALGLGFAGGVTAAPLSPVSAGAPAAVLDGGVYNLSNPVALEQAQWFYGGRNYCFYLNGWRGPGYYWCGYQFRRGYGWGGPEGWRGWNHNRRNWRGHGWHGRGDWNGRHGHNGRWNGHGGRWSGQDHRPR